MLTLGEVLMKITSQTNAKTIETPEVSKVLPSNAMSIYGDRPKVDRRRYRRCDLELHRVSIERYDAHRDSGQLLGHVLNLSAGGLRFRTIDADTRVGAQIRIRLRLPSYAGICPFVAPDGSGRGTDQWIGWASIIRVQKADDNAWDVAAKLVDMREIDRGMLQLYLSAQPLAA